MHQRKMESGVWGSFESHRSDPESRAEIVLALMDLAQRMDFCWANDDLVDAVDAVCDVADRYDFATGAEAAAMVVQIVDMLGWHSRRELDQMFQPGSPVLN